MNRRGRKRKLVLMLSSDDSDNGGGGKVGEDEGNRTDEDHLEELDSDDDEEDEEGRSGRGQSKDRKTPISGEPYVDLAGNVWEYLAPAGYLASHYPLLGLEKSYESKWSSVMVCQLRFDKKCPYLMLLLKLDRKGGGGLIYQRNEHNHEVSVTPEQLLTGNKVISRREGVDWILAEELDCTGWNLIAEGVHNTDPLEKRAKEKSLRKYREDDRVLRYWCPQRKCGVKLWWLKRRKELWEVGEHRHPLGGGGKGRGAKRRRLDKIEEEIVEMESATAEPDAKDGGVAN